MIKGIFIELLSGVQGEPTEWNGQLDKENFLKDIASSNRESQNEEMGFR
jgi:hypothetical protein